MKLTLIKHILLVLCLCSMVSCVRYIDSRKQLADQNGGFDPAKERAGIEGFYRYEQEQRKRLELLIKERELDFTRQTNRDYRIGAGDVISLTVKDFEAISKEYTVGQDGYIRLPFVGKVDCGGLTESAASNVIARLVTDYVIEPQVDIQVVTYSTNVVWVINSNNRNGVGNNNTEQRTAIPIKRQDYSLKDLIVELGDSSILDRGAIHIYPAGSDGLPSHKQDDLVSRFNGFNVNNWSQGKVPEVQDCNGQEFQPEGSTFRVKACYPYYNDVSRQDLAAKYESGSRIEIDIEELFGGVTRRPLNLYLKAGDLIHVPPLPSIQMFGEVNRRGSVQIAASGNGTLAAGSKPTLFSALSFAGGLTYSANINEVLIYREIHFGNKAILSLDLEKVVLLAGQDVRLRDGDIVYVPSRENRYYRQQSVNAINQITGAFRNVDTAVDIDFSNGR